MNKYDIQIGDYVETTDGAVGYVNYIDEDCFTATLVKNVKLRKGIYVKFYTLEDNDSIIKQVGANKFRKEQESKLSHVTKIIGDGSPVYSKLNELIDHINAIQEMLTKENK